MNKIVAILLAIIISAALLSACNSSPDVIPNKEEHLTGHSDVTDDLKETITIGVIRRFDGISSDIDIAIGKYNQSSGQYKIVVRDYSEGGKTNAADAIRQLNIEVISGNGPDMICFAGLSPFPYLSKELLVDLSTYFDNEINFENLVSPRALKSFNGVYLLGSGFIIETLIGDKKVFGNQYGWTMDQFIDLEGHMPQGRQMIYNMSKSKMFSHLYKRYLRTSINWAKGTCDFVNPDFLKMMEVSSTVKEAQEADGNILFGYGAELVHNGQLQTALVFATNIHTLPQQEKIGNMSFSYIGWPTINGSCGTDLNIEFPVGILNTSSNLQECWNFIKILVTNSNPNNAMPLYKPALLTQFDAAIASEKGDERLSVSDRDNLLALLDNIETLAIYDDTVIGIIDGESENFFSGKKSSLEVAQIIQSKVSVYLSEISS